jgi:hypothetical protein
VLRAVPLLIWPFKCRRKVLFGIYRIYDSTHLTLIFLSGILPKPSAYLGVPIFHTLILPFLDNTRITARKVKTLPSKFEIAQIAPVLYGQLVDRATYETGGYFTFVHF